MKGQLTPVLQGHMLYEFIQLPPVINNNSSRIPGTNIELRIEIYPQRMVHMHGPYPTRNDALAAMTNDLPKTDHIFSPMISGIFAN